MSSSFSNCIYHITCWAVVKKVSNTKFYWLYHFWQTNKKSVRTSSHIIQPTFLLHFAGSIYTTLALAVERYISVCHPHHVGFEHAGIMSIAGLITFSVVFNTGRFLEFETVYDNAVSIFTYNNDASTFSYLFWKLTIYLKNIMAIFPFHKPHASLREIEKSVNSDILKQKTLYFLTLTFSLSDICFSFRPEVFLMKKQIQLRLSR